MPNVSPICSCSLTITVDTVHKLDFIKDSKPNSADKTFPQQGFSHCQWLASIGQQTKPTPPASPTLLELWRLFFLHFFSLFLFHFYICHLALSIFVLFMTIFYVIKKLYIFSQIVLLTPIFYSIIQSYIFKGSPFHKPYRASMGSFASYI